MKAMTYQGGLPSGYVLDPLTRQEFPFEQGKEILVPEALADRCQVEKAEEFKDIRTATAEEVEAAEELQRLERTGKQPAKSTEEITKQEGELN